MATHILSTFIDILSENELVEPYLRRNQELYHISKKAMVLMGVRRAGKTTLLQQLREDALAAGTDRSQILYCNFSDERLIGLQAADLGLLLEAQQQIFPAFNSSKKFFLFLDEIQMIENWELFVERMTRNNRCEVTVTGSSARMLSKEIATAMRGRSVSFEVFPFSFSEYLRFRHIPSNLQNMSQRPTLRNALKDYLTWGSFPEIISLHPTAKRKVLQEYVEVLLLKDIVERNNFSNPQLARTLFFTLLNQVAMSFTINKTWNKLRSLGFRLEKSVVSDFLAWSEDCYALFQVQLFSESPTKRSSNPKKIYCIDAGFATLSSRGTSENRGKLLENAVYLHIRRNYSNVSYYRTRSGYEIDFVYQTETGTMHLIQVCESLNISPTTRNRELRALNEAARELRTETARPFALWIVTLDEETNEETAELTESAKNSKNSKEEPIDDPILVLPAWKYLLTL